MASKIRFFIIFFTFSWLSLSCASTPPSGANNVYVSPTVTVSPTINTTLSSVTTINVDHTFKMPKFSLPNMKPFLDYAKSKTSSAQSWMWTEKWALLAAGITSCYFALYYELHQINLMLLQPNSWCLWKEVVPLGHLAMTSASDLQQQIEFDLHKRYYSSLNYKDFQAIHELFLEDTCNEMAMLEKYLLLYKFFHISYLHKLLPFSHTPETINARKDRLNFVIDLFISWHIKKQIAE